MPLAEEGCQANSPWQHPGLPRRTKVPEGI
jgi:hypothetical protein